MSVRHADVTTTQRVAFRVFSPAIFDQQSAMKEAAEFASNLDPGALINMTGTRGQYITVWYWRSMEANVS